MKTAKKMLAIALCLAFGMFAVACGAELNPKTEGQIQSALEAKRGAFKSCYEQALERDRNVKGPMNLVLDVHEESGKVTEAKVERTPIKDKKMKKCVSNAAGAIAVPDPPGVPVEGHYDLKFDFEKE